MKSYMIWKEAGKPFIEEGLRTWIRSQVNEPWFRAIMHVGKDESGQGRLYFGNKGRFGSLPLMGGLIGLTALTGAAHVDIPNSPYITYIVNEVIDEIGPALKAAYDEGRLPTAEEIKEAQDTVKKICETSVKVLFVCDTGEYEIHHPECISAKVRSARTGTKKKKKKGEGDDVGDGEGAEIFNRPLISAIRMHAKPAVDCPQCGDLMEEMMSKKEKAEAEKAQKEKKETSTPAHKSPLDVLSHLSVAEQLNVYRCLSEWKRQEPEKVGDIDMLVRALDTQAEAKAIGHIASELVVFRDGYQVVEAHMGYVLDHARRLFDNALQDEYPDMLGLSSPVLFKLNYCLDRMDREEACRVKQEIKTQERLEWLAAHVDRAVKIEHVRIPCFTDPNLTMFKTVVSHLLAHKTLGLSVRYAFRQVFGAIGDASNASANKGPSTLDLTLWKFRNETTGKKLKSFFWPL